MPNHPQPHTRNKARWMKTRPVPAPVRRTWTRSRHPRRTPSIRLDHESDGRQDPEHTWAHSWKTNPHPSSWRPIFLILDLPPRVLGLAESINGRWLRGLSPDGQAVSTRCVAAVSIYMGCVYHAPMGQVWRISRGQLAPGWMIWFSCLQKYVPASRESNWLIWRTLSDDGAGGNSIRTLSGFRTHLSGLHSRRLRDVSAKACRNSGFSAMIYVHVGYITPVVWGQRHLPRRVLR